MRTGGLLTLHAHPDDETLSSGGTLASWAAAGLPVTLVTCTRGERGEVIGADLQYLLHDADAFGGHRTGELSAAVAALGGPGAIEQLFLDELPVEDGAGDAVPANAPAAAASRNRNRNCNRYRDSGMVWLRPGVAGPAPDAGPEAFSAADVESAAWPLAELIRKRRPDFLLSYDSDGGYGHPDHVMARAVAQRAAELVPGTRLLEIVRPQVSHLQMFEELDEAISPSWLTERDLVLTDRNAMPALVRAAVGQKKNMGSQSQLIVDVKPVADRVLQALRQHATQVQHVTQLLECSWVIGAAALSNAELNPVPAREYLQPVLGDFAGVSREILPPNVAWGDEDF